MGRSSAPTTTTSASTPRIIWPAPGLPAFIEGEQRRFRALIEYASSADELRDWVKGLSLQCPLTGTTTDLVVTALCPFDGASTHRFAAQYLHSRGAAKQLFEVEIRVPASLEPPKPRTALAFHLTREGIIVRPNAVAILAPGKRTLRLAFATDLHVADAWNTIEAAITQHAPDLVAHYFHPQRLLATFIEECNQLAARGELDLVVLGGDLVDHIYHERQNLSASRSNDSNVRLLLSLLTPLMVPVLAIPGNHDYRVNPRRPRVAGLGSVGITPGRSKHLLQLAGLWDRWPVRLSDRAALHTVGSDGADALDEHWSTVAPATDFFIDVRGTRLVFFETGSDMILHWRSLDWPRRALLARSMTTSWEDPDSAGPSDEQLGWLETVLEGAGHAALFFHAPLFNPLPHQRVEDLITDVNPRDAHAAGTLAFERRLFASGLRRGVAFRNITRVLRALAEVRGSVTTFSGHVHRASRLEVERPSLRMRSALVEGGETDPQTMTLHIGAALGHVRAPGHEPPSYLRAEFTDGALQHVRHCRVGGLCS